LSNRGNSPQKPQKGTQKAQISFAFFVSFCGFCGEFPSSGNRIVKIVILYAYPIASRRGMMIITSLEVHSIKSNFAEVDKHLAFILSSR
jgi:hypothetical protein